ncbi:DNA-binding transcriptional MocR family regulator [Bradyrhizobium sp. LB13.1]
MTKPLRLKLDRSAKTPLAEQIRKGIGNAIASGVLAPGARLPSWQDMAAQLGVARGTVRSAYQKLSSAQLIVASRATGTHVADRPSLAARQEQAPDSGSFMEMYRELTAGPAVFQMGVPSNETVPAKLFARMRAQAVRAEMSAPAIYPDPRGELDLRREIAALPCASARNRVRTFPNHHHQRFQWRPRTGAPRSRPRAKKGLGGGSRLSLHP